MGIGEVQFGGLASGLDTNALVAAIVNLESRPIRVLEGQRQEQQSRLSLIGTFEGLVNDLQERASDLSERSEFLANSLSVGTEGIASFSVTSGAVEGSHDLTVQSLATADRFTFDPIASLDQRLGFGTVRFSYDGVDFAIDIGEGQDTLEGIASAVNSAADGAVQASVVNAGTEGSPQFQLVIAGGETGEDF